MQLQTQATRVTLQNDGAGLRYVGVIVRRYISVTGKTDVTLLWNGDEIPVEDTGILD